MVAVRFSDGTNAVMVNVTDVAAASPEVVPMGNDAAIMLEPYDAENYPRRTAISS